jgi:hypothetical protein
LCLFLLLLDGFDIALGASFGHSSVADTGRCVVIPSAYSQSHSPALANRFEYSLASGALSMMATMSASLEAIRQNFLPVSTCVSSPVLQLSNAVVPILARPAPAVEPLSSTGGVSGSLDTEPFGKIKFSG